MQGRQPVVILRKDATREHGRRAQLNNIAAGRAVGQVVRTTLGPRSMLKMLLDPMGGIVLTNDGHAILREMDVSHPAARAVIDICRTQDEETGDGTTSVVILAGEILTLSESMVRSEAVHPVTIIKGFHQLLRDADEILRAISIPVQDDAEAAAVVESCVGTKFGGGWGALLARLAVEACRVVRDPSGQMDVKRYAKVEKIPGGLQSETVLVQGVVVNKDVTHPKMARRVESPKILLLDCTLEYKKGESSTAVEITREEDWEKLLAQEEAEVERFCADIAATGCNVCVTEKGVSDLAQHFLARAGITVFRRVRKSDVVRIARVSGARVVNRTEEALAEDLGTRCGLMEVRKVGDEYFVFFEQCQDPKACSIVLRGGSKDTLNEVERNLHDALAVAKNVLATKCLLPGGGASEVELYLQLREKAQGIADATRRPYLAAAEALLVIPRTLMQNCGLPTLKTLAALQATHKCPHEPFKSLSDAKERTRGVAMGLDGATGEIVNALDRGIIDTLAVKLQTLTSAIEAASMLLRIDDVVAGLADITNQLK